MRPNISRRKQGLKKLTVDERRRRVFKFLRTEVWPTIPKKFLGKRPTRREEDEILGYGPHGF